MLANISGFGHYLLFAVFLCSGLATILALAALKPQDKSTVKVLLSAKIAMLVAAGLCAVVFALFAAAFLTDDFSIAAVAQHSSTQLPSLYKLSAVWASSAGSLLLWSVGIFVLYAFYLLTLRTDGSTFNAAALAIGAGISLAFSAILFFIAKPFAGSLPVIDEGAGLNPLLQNFWMVVHPPVLFIGYSAFLIPFVIVLASVFAGRTQEDNIYGQLRRWLLFAIFSLGLSIFADARWSYIGFRWGGYWVWEPVQNLSLVHWLVAVAALHSLAGMQVADKFRRWTLVLAPVPFILCLFLTFIIASGMLTSVHSFDSSIAFELLLGIAGYCFLLWLICIMRVAKIVPVISTRQGAFHLDKSRMLFWLNIILIVTAAVISLTTLLPAVQRVVTNLFIRLTLFYDRVISIIGIVLAFLVGLYRLACLQQRHGGSKMPSLASCAAGILCFGLLFRLTEQPLLICLTCGICAFSFVAVFIDLLVNIKRGGKIAGGIAHFGLLLVVATAGFTLAETEQRIGTGLTMGKKVTIGGCEFVYNSFKRELSGSVEKAGPEISVRKGRIHVRLWPHRNTYHDARDTAKEESISEPAVYNGLLEDIRVSFDGQKPDGSVMITAKIRPFMVWLWLAVLLIVAGTGLAVLARRSKPEIKTESPPAEDEFW